MRHAPATACGTIGCLFVSIPVLAANADYQAFFFSVCATATGALASRCAETPDGLGNLSGDSESSLNPSQNLSHALSPVGTAQTRSNAARERGERQREGDTEQDAPLARIEAGPFSLLLNLHGTSFDRGAQGDLERGLNGDSLAGELGLDWRLSDRMVVGAILGIERLSYEFDAEAQGVNFIPPPIAGEVDLDNVYLTLFASLGVGDGGYVDVIGGLESSDGEYRRNSVFQESTRTRPQTQVRVAGQADGTTAWASVNAGYLFSRGPASFGPYGGITWTKSKLDGYTERDLSGSGLAMRFAGTSRDSLLAHAGLRFGWTLGLGPGVLLPQLRIEYQREIDRDAPTAAGRFDLDPAGTQYTLAGARPDDDAFNASLSVAAVLRNGWMAFLDLAILLGSEDLDRQRATLGLRKEF